MKNSHSMPLIPSVREVNKSQVFAPLKKGVMPSLFSMEDTKRASVVVNKKKKVTSTLRMKPMPTIVQVPKETNFRSVD